MNLYKELLIGAGASDWLDLLCNPARSKFSINLLRVKLFDYVHGTNFWGENHGRVLQNELGVSAKIANDYSATPRTIIKVLKDYNIGPNDSIIDIGCGRGLAMYYMLKFPFHRVDGIDISDKLIASAKKNVAILINNAKVNFYEMDAGEYTRYCDYNYFYIYNSLPKKVMEKFVLRVEESIKIKQRKITIFYLMPEYPEVLLNSTAFKLISRESKNEIRNGMWVFEYIPE